MDLSELIAQGSTWSEDMLKRQRKRYSDLQTELVSLDGCIKKTMKTQEMIDNLHTGLVRLMGGDLVLYFFVSSYDIKVPDGSLMMSAKDVRFKAECFVIRDQLKDPHALDCLAYNFWIGDAALLYSAALEPCETCGHPARLVGEIFVPQKRSDVFSLHRLCMTCPTVQKVIEVDAGQLADVRRQHTGVIERFHGQHLSATR